jgi:signal recognition particle receptor subunit beta
MRHHLRISIIGPPGCGKTTFLRTLVPTALDTDDYRVPRPDRASLSHARYIVSKDDILDILAIRIPDKDSLISIILDGMAGHIFMLDSTAPEGWFEIQPIMRLTRAPSIIVANKQNHPLAHSMTAIRKTMATPLPIYPCDATDNKLVKKLVRDLLHRILSELEA